MVIKLPVIKCMSCNSIYNVSRSKITKCNRCNGIDKNLFLLGYGTPQDYILSSAIENYKPKKTTIDPNSNIGRMANYFNVDANIILEFVEAIASISPYLKEKSTWNIKYEEIRRMKKRLRERYKYYKVELEHKLAKEFEIKELEVKRKYLEKLNELNVK